MNRASFLALFVTAVLLGPAVAPQAYAIVQDSSGLNGVPAEPGDNHSFVTDYLNRIVALDDTYMNDVRTNFPGQSADIVMQQCFGGGFANDAGALTNYTFASSTRWDQLSYSSYDGGLFVSSLEDFTRAWRANASLATTNFSMNRHFQTAVSGNILTTPNIPKEKFAVPATTTQKYYEYPQYRSPDANTSGPNDSRNLYQQYAILVNWSTSIGSGYNDSVGDLIRVYNTLRTEYDIPTGHIVVLDTYGKVQNTARYLHDGTLQDSWPSDTADDQYVYVDDSNERANWISALRGNYFTDADGNAQRPGATDYLFIYNTGHGGRGQYGAARATPGNPRGWQVMGAAVASNWAGNAGRAAESEAGTLMNDDGTISIQVAARNPLLGALNVLVNGWSGVILPTGPGLELDLGNFAPADDPSLSFYSVSVPYDAAQGFSDGSQFFADIDIPFLDNPQDVWAFTLAGGSFEFIATVPEPASLIMLTLGLMSLAAYYRFQRP